MSETNEVLLEEKAEAYITKEKNSKDYDYENNYIDYIEFGFKNNYDYYFD